jgi:fructose 1,6-bisphosphatase
VITISAIKADIGGYVGHSAMHPDVLVECSGVWRQQRQPLGRVDGLNTRR